MRPEPIRHSIKPTSPDTESTLFNKWIYPVLYWGVVLGGLAWFALVVFYIAAHGN